LAHLNLEPETAKECWEKIVIHREMLNKCLKRDVTIQTVICDYFCSIDMSLKTPKVVEISVFESKEKASRYDELTGLFNRSQLNESINQELARSNRHNYEFSILFLDLDHFKKVNDTYGHLAGDFVLKNMSRLVMEEIRTEDIAIRYGGEEILIILPQTGKMKALALGERIREKIKMTPNIYENKHINMTVSGGLASFPADGQNINELVEHADRGLYQAKSYGRDNIAIYSKNKRRFIRFDFFTDIQVQKIDNLSASDEIATTTKNFSQTGLLFESKILFEIGDVVQLKIRLETNSSHTQITGKVVRTEISEPTLYDIGISFIKTDQEIENDVSKFVNQYLTENSG